jgi:hypothetical protein
MIDEGLIGNELVGSGRDLIMVMSLRIYLMGLSKARK